MYGDKSKELQSLGQVKNSGAATGKLKLHAFK
jgi:hypothetical protein